MKIVTISVTEFGQNCRIIMSNGLAAIVDPGGEVDHIVSVVSAAGVVVTQIVLTHSHLDHVGGVAALLQIAGQKTDLFSQDMKLLGHAMDKSLRARVEEQAAMFGFEPNEFLNCPEPDIFVEDNEQIQLANTSWQVLFTPGHAPGHVCLYYKIEPSINIEAGDVKAGDVQSENVQDSHVISCVTVDGQFLDCSKYSGILISGDALFNGSIGRTDLPGGDYQQLIGSIKDKLLVLDDETLVLPGHGPETTIGRERRDNPFLRCS